MTQTTDARVRRSYSTESDPFLQQLEQAIEIAPVSEDQIDVVMWNDREQTLLGTFADYSTAGRHRQAVIDAVLAARLRGRVAA